ncbi:isoaspartyl peptidase/L-asparaginase family protein [Occallatibacter riparius]|uniref:Isoaspartyl peptidase n=1 Tax=Occallatibacter riparius TaxID=1002689 RepID=A0A9J7BX54_9BACT|nr:isoaspartyl peptidase/L-asparaginase [Occallatibacter riparius]UWZ85669.1 isoaspartyl peptidase/L-asparaginase [Occallatibacter riparius]
MFATECWRRWIVCVIVGITGACAFAQAPAPKAPAPWAIEIHGGAGEAEWLSMDQATADAYRASLARALAAGSAVLEKHGTAMDAVQAAVEVLEDDPLFNAGRGSAFAADATNEMDASIMNGIDTTGAGVAGVHFTRHPIQLARAVMEHTQYVLMAGPGADAFSKQQGLEQEPTSYFFTEMRWKEFEEVMRKSNRPVPARPAGAPPPPAQSSKLAPGIFSHLFGTVGAVARDSSGHLAAATSTGGMQGKLPGRIGDSPILGAGTYADDKGCAVSGTGVGEYFIRLSLAHQVGELCRKGEAPQHAADQLIHTDLPALPGGEGGVIVLGRTGMPVWSNNTLGMFHARQIQGGQPEVWVK